MNHEAGTGFHGEERSHPATVIPSDERRHTGGFKQHLRKLGFLPRQVALLLRPQLFRRIKFAWPKDLPFGAWHRLERSLR